jgi:phosphatidylglycerol lysyltransferase
MSALRSRTATVLREAPFSAAMVITLWLVAFATGSVRHGPRGRLLAEVGIGSGPGPTHWWSPFTSALYCADVRGYLFTTLLVAGFAVPVERRLGPLRTAVAWATVQLLAAPAAMLLWWALSGHGWWQTAPTDPMVPGPGPAVLGLAVAGSAGLAPLWRRRLRVVLVLLLAALLYTARPTVLFVLVAGLVGLAIGGAVRRGRPGAPAVPPTRPEVRLLLAVAVAMSAIGPLAATVAAQHGGPFAVSRVLLVASPPEPGDVQAACADPALAEQCRAMLAQVHAGGLGPSALSLLPFAMMLLAALGLRRGRRSAWWLAFVLNLAIAGLGAVVFDVVDLLTGAPQDAAGTVPVVAAVVQPLLIAVLLLAFRRRFSLPTPRSRRRDLWLLGVAGPAGAAVVYLCGGYLLRHQFAPVPTLPHLLADMPLRFLPVGYLDAFPPSFLPEGTAATVLWGWAGTAGWLAALTGIARTFGGDRPADAADAAATTRRLLVEHGGDSVSHMVTWPQNSHWISDDGRVAVAYRLISSVALTLGGPVGDPALRTAAMRHFSRYCLERGWTPCFYGITATHADALRANGWGVVQVAEETVLPLAGLTFRGRRWQDVRTALNRAARDGIEAQWHLFAQAPPALAAQVRAISDTWLAAKGLPELGFTLGGVEQLADEEVRCLLAVDGDGRVHAVTSWLPVHRDGRVVGWTLDLMRRGPDAANGVMEFLVASAALHCQAEGAEFLSLSGAPLARRDEVPPTGLAQLLDRLGTTLEPVYGFRSLLAFKAKFQPEYRPLLLAYPDPAALPTIGNAVARAYLPSLTPAQGVRLVRHLLRQRAPRPVGPAAPAERIPEAVAASAVPDRS